MISALSGVERLSQEYSVAKKDERFTNLLATPQGGRCIRQLSLLQVSVDCATCARPNWVEWCLRSSLCGYKVFFLADSDSL